MLESIEFHNFKVLRDAKLPLGPCTILIGANGSGKSTVLEALEAASGKMPYEFSAIVSAELRGQKDAVVSLKLHWGEPVGRFASLRKWRIGTPMLRDTDGSPSPTQADRATRFCETIHVYSLDAKKIAEPVKMTPDSWLAFSGAGLAGALTHLNNRHRDRFDALEGELSRWLPEFSHILFEDDPNEGRHLLLETTEGHYRIPASDLSQGTLIALTILTLVYAPGTPSMICLEEPDRGIHPRLLRRVQDAIYRLSHPESCGEKREPIQVIATTHSPYFLDLFKDHPEEIVVANREGSNVRFERVSDQPHIREILGDSAFGEAWYSGVIGGVPGRS